MSDHAPSRPWLRFRLRMLFLMMLVLAIPLGWIGVQLRWIRDLKEFIAETVARCEAVRTSEGEIDRYQIRPYVNDSTDAPWSIRIFGEEGLLSLAVVVESPMPEKWKRLFPEHGLYYEEERQF